MKDNTFYMHQPQLVLGFHGCEKARRDIILNSSTEHLKKSNNSYDWLGSGAYFWLNDPQRALEWAKQQGKKEPAVLGAIIDLGDCLNLCERPSIHMLQIAYQRLKLELEQQKITMKENKAPDKGGFKLLRYRDCAVIERLHTLLEEEQQQGFDTVYGYFQEDEEAYPGAGMMAKSHIQICVRNLNNIKGYFLPREYQD